MDYGKSGQIVVHDHSVFSGPRKHSGKIFKSEISFNHHSTANVSAEATLNRDLLH